VSEFLIIDLVLAVRIKRSCHGLCSFATPHEESNGSDELRKLGHIGKWAMHNAGEDYWPWPGRSLMQAQPLFVMIK
jgi:hypothetical protein